MAGTIMGLLSGPALAQQPGTIPLPVLDVTASRLGTAGIVGASTTIVTAEEIARSPGATLQDILARQPGIQTWSLYGGVGGAGTVVDMRGFGAAATANTLVLLNGRRLNDIDLASVDFSAIPRDSIERIEITRGNSGAVLYGQGAVGGVINIVTKTGAGLSPRARIEGGVGSFGHRDVRASAGGSSGAFSASVYGDFINADGYRENNRLRQRNATGDLRYTGEDGTAYLTIAADDQRLGLPGGRLVDRGLGIDELATDRRGATTPTAFADRQGISATAGFTRILANGVELIVDGGVRRKEQQAFTELGGFAASDARELVTVSLTPRIVSRRDLFGLPSTVIAGFDFYHSDFWSNRSTLLSDPPIHRYDLAQRSMALYWQQTVAATPQTDISWGVRGEYVKVHARDRFDPNAPGAFFFDMQALPYDRTDMQHAAHVGFEHRFDERFAVFGRIGRSFRMPNVDERVGVSAFPVDFDLRPQTSWDMEAGVRLRLAGVEVQTSVYDMLLRDELHFVPFPPLGANTNLDPTRRQGSETLASWRASDRLRVHGGLAYTQATFRGGPNTGREVPLVSRWTASAGFSFDIWKEHLVWDTVVRYVGPRRMDNDQANFQPKIPGHALVDMRIGGEYRNLFWSFAVHNLFDAKYFDYAAASSAVFARYNAYPQPGRSFLLRAGVKLP